VSIRDKDQRFKVQLEAWCKALINLSRANRLLYLKLGSVLEIVEPAVDYVYERLGTGLEVAESCDIGPFSDEPPKLLRSGRLDLDRSRERRSRQS